MGSCLEEALVAAFVARRVSTSEDTIVHTHIDVCSACRMLVAEAARVLGIAENQTPALTPEPVGRYIAGREHGRGGQARVVATYDTALDRTVALKELLPERDGEDARVRFLREARVTAKLAHPGVVPVHDVYARDDGSMFYTMPVIGGKTLADALRAQSFEARVRFLPRVLNLCQTVAFAHSKGVLHRDLKPHNVIVGEFGETIVIDWGLAGGAPALGGDAHVTRGPVGTPAYMSPEQARGEPLDERADVYGLGAVLHELCAGAPPRSGGDVESILRAARSGGVAPLPNDCPPELAAIVRRALAPHKEDRYPSAAELARDLESYLGGQRVEAHRYDVRAHIARFAKQHRAWMSAGVASFALLVASLAAVSVAFQRAEARAHQLQYDRAAEALDSGNQIDAAAKIRAALDSGDDLPTRALYWRLGMEGPLLWQHAVCKCEDRRVHLVDTRTLATQMLVGLDDEITAVASDGRQIIAGAENGALGVWQVGDRSFSPLPFVAGRVWSIALTDTVIAATHSGGALQVIDRTSHKNRAVHPLPGNGYGVAIDPSGQSLAVTAADNQLRIFDLARGELRASWPGFRGALAFHPTGQTLAVSDPDGWTSRLDWRDGRVLSRTRAHTQRAGARVFRQWRARCVGLSRRDRQRPHRRDATDPRTTPCMGGRRRVRTLRTAARDRGLRWDRARVGPRHPAHA